MCSAVTPPDLVGPVPVTCVLGGGSIVEGSKSLLSIICNAWTK